MTLKVLGLGPGHLDQVSLEIWQALQEAPVIYCRTKDHPAVVELEEAGFPIESFDSIYEEEEDFEKVYPRIVETLLELHGDGEQDVLYAVPGHPMVGETSVQLLLAQEDVAVDILGGSSFLDALFTSVNYDPIQGFQLLDALAYDLDTINPSQAHVFMQVYHPFVASDLKLDLMEVFPDDHPVAWVEAAGSPEEQVTWLPLYELDHFDGVRNLLSVFVSALGKEEDHEVG